MSHSRLLMLGAAPETRGSIASVVEAYRAHGLFKRWPIDYVPTDCDGTLGQRTVLALKAAQALAGALLRDRGLALHAHVSVRGFWRDLALLAPAAAARCPIILHLHGSGFERFYDGCDGAGRMLIRAALQRAVCVIAPCESVGAWAIGVARAAHVVCLPSPVTLEAAAKDPGAPNLILFLGHMAPEKGVFDLLEAVAALRTAVPDVRLVCAGDGSRVAVARYAERLGIAEAVKFTGWVGPSGKRALFESAAVLAAPAYDAALPLSLLEAMAAGVPVVASAVGGVPEVIVNGVTGFLVAPGDNASLGRLLRTLLLERALGARVAAAARESVRVRFAPERALRGLEEIYASIGVQGAGVPPAPDRTVDLRKAA